MDFQLSPITLSPYNPEFPISFQWLTLDIETIAGSPEDADRFIINCYRVDSFKSWSDITIGRKIKEAHAKKLERLSLLSAAPIICISLRSDQALHCFHCLDKCTITQVEGATVTAAADGKAMLINLRDYLDNHLSPDTVIVGHNIAAFDLPKLRWAFVRQGVRLPGVLAVTNPNVYDTMQAYTRRYAVGSSAMIGLDALLEEFQIESHKGMVSGKDVQQLYDDGAHDTIVQYALLDVLAESELYLRMTGRSEALQ